MIHRVIIIGGGCAGLTSALYLARSDYKPLIFVGSLEDKGGLLTKTSVVENYPGFPNGIEGYDLISNMSAQAEKYGATFLDNEIIKVDFSQKPFLLIDDNHETHKAETVVIATGSKPNKLGLPNEEKFWSSGISSCAVCDGALYRNRKICVLGGGDSALEEAVFLTKFSDVTLIHRRDKFRASVAMQKKVIDNEKINIIYDTIITSLNGTSRLESISCQNIKNGTIFNLPVDGLFYGLGLNPNTHIFANQLDMDEDGYIKKINSEDTSTSIEGIFVAGDCADRIYRQAIVASGDGCKSAIDVDHYLNE